MTGKNVPLTRLPADSPPSNPALSGEELTTSGLLHVLNESILWPLGLALTVAVDLTPEGRDWQTARLSIQDLDEVVVSGLTEEDHVARHAAFDAWQASLVSRIKP
jgi:hypothetical protein